MAEKKLHGLTRNQWFIVGGVVAAYLIIKNAPKVAGGLVTDSAGELGKAVVGIPGAIATGVTNALLDPNTNPLYDFGTWLGGQVYDVTHPAPSTLQGAPAPIHTLRMGRDGVYR
jgi:hypothetical protein